MDGVTARAVLGLADDAALDHDMITAAYRRRAKHLHPDAGGTARAFARLREAVGLLRSQTPGTTATAICRRSSPDPYQAVVYRPPSTWDRVDSSRRRTRTGPSAVPSFADVLARAMAG